MSKRSGCYYVAITGSFEYFQYFNFKLSIPKKVTLLKKNKLDYCCYLKVLRLKTQRTFPLKIHQSKANFKINRIKSTKWTHQKERSFDTNYFVFLKI